jgi:hypothetical protein
VPVFFADARLGEKFDLMMEDKHRIGFWTNEKLKKQNAAGKSTWTTVRNQDL